MFVKIDIDGSSLGAGVRHLSQHSLRHFHNPLGFLTFRFEILNP